MTKHFLLVVFLVAFLVRGGAFAAEIPEQRFAKEYWNPRLLELFDPARVAWTQSLISPPPSLMEEQGELYLLVQKTKNRTKIEEEEIIDINRSLLIYMFRTIGLDTQKTGSVNSLLYQAQVFLNQKILEEKWRYARIPPHYKNDKIQTMDDILFEMPSYPSEYAAQAMMASLLLSDLFPDKNHLWVAWAHYIGGLFETAGLQYPSDTKAGYELARKALGLYRQTDPYKKALLEAEIELVAFEPDVMELENKIKTLLSPISFP